MLKIWGKSWERWRMLMWECRPNESDDLSYNSLMYFRSGGQMKSRAVRVANPVKWSHLPWERLWRNKAIVLLDLILAWNCADGPRWELSSILQLPWDPCSKQSLFCSLCSVVEGVATSTLSMALQVTSAWKPLPVWLVLINVFSAGGEHISKILSTFFDG